MNGRRLQTPPRTGNGLFPGQQEDVLTPIMGGPKATVGQARTWLKRKAPEWAEMADLYYSIAPRYGIRADVALAQSAKETAFGKYGGAVKPEQNNWCGVKTKNATGDKPEDHETFPTPEEGVRAHFNHICAYVGLNPIGEPHGRYLLVKSLLWAGSVRYVEELGGKWAPSSDYGKSIVRDYLTGLMGTLVPGPGPDDQISDLEAKIAKLQKKVNTLQAENRELANILKNIAMETAPYMIK